MVARIGKYEIQKELGRGAFTQVFQALDPSVERVVAVKVLNKGSDKKFLKDFRSEAAAVAKLHHKGIITIYELGEHEGFTFVAMEYLEGRTLRQVIAEGAALPLLHKVAAMTELADALECTHASGTAHLDIKPVNIMVLADGSVKLADFRVASRSSRTVLNNALYTAPEQFAGPEEAEGPSDLFVYGVIFYELLTGKHPFEAKDADGVSFRIMKEEPPPVRLLSPECPEALERIVHRALQKDSRLRYQSFEDVQFELEPILADLKSEARRQRATARPTPVPPAAPATTPEVSAEQKRRAAALLAEAESAYGQMNFAEAKQKASQAQQLDPTSKMAAPLLDAISAMHDFESESGRPVSQPAHVAELLKDLDLDVERVLGKPAQAPQPPIEQARREARTLEEARDFIGAIRILERALTAFPKETELLRAKEEAAAALASFKRQKAIENARSEAAALSKASDFAGAIRVLEQALAIYPEDAELRRAKEAAATTLAVAETVGKCGQLRKQDRFTEALQLIQATLEKYSGDQQLLNLRSGLEKEWEQHQRAAAVRQAVQDAQRFLDQGRPDLAVPLLKKNCEMYAGEAELTSTLAAAEKALPSWERTQLIQEILACVAPLEQRQQWRTALTILQEALERYPDATELSAAAARNRKQSEEAERQQRLARRVAAIEQKIGTKGWLQALELLEDARKEFGQQPEIERLSGQIRRGQQRTQCDDLILRIEQCLSDGELAQASELIQKATMSFPQESRLQSLRAQLEGEEAFHKDLGSAQVLLGRSRFDEAQTKLQELAKRKPGSAEVQALLEAVRLARASEAEKQAYAWDREKALALVREQQFAQAVGLLRKMLQRFPSDPVIAKDLESAEEQARKAAEKPAPALPPPTPLPAALQPSEVSDSQGSRRAIWAAAAVVLVVIGLLGWKFSRDEAGAVSPTPSAAPAVQPASSAEAPAPAAPKPAVKAPEVVKETPRPEKVVEKTAPVAKQPETTPSPTPAPVAMSTPTPTPTPTEEELRPPAISPTTAAAPPRIRLPSSVGAVGSVVVPPPVVPQPTAPTKVEANPRVGGNFQEPKLISGPQPSLPAIAKERSVYGTVRVEATITKEGTVKDVKVLGGHPLLLSAAVDAIKQRRYQPATLNGEPVETRVPIQIVFQPIERRR